MTEQMTIWASIFRAHCPYDKSYITEIIKKFPVSVFACGKHLNEKAVRWSYIIESDTDNDRLEFLDFIDGNGFRVVANQCNKKFFHIYPIYDK